MELVLIFLNLSLVLYYNIVYEINLQYNTGKLKC